MNPQVKTAATAARAYYEAEQAFESAKEALMPYAKLQAELTKKVIKDLGMDKDYSYRPYFRYDWIELEIGGHYVGTSDIPVITCQLWERGRCGDSDSIEGGFDLSPHILNDNPEMFEAELRAKLGTEADKKKLKQIEAKQREIAELQERLAQLQRG